MLTNAKADKITQMLQSADRMLFTQGVDTITSDEMDPGLTTNPSGTKVGGYMNPFQFKTFMLWIQDASPFLGKIRTEYLTAPTREIDRTGLGKRILHGRQEAEALTPNQYVKVEFGKMELSTKKVMAQANITYESLEDNIERGNFRSILMRMISEQVSRDLETFVLCADTRIPVVPTPGDPFDYYAADGNDLLCLQDGLIKRVFTQKESGMPSQMLTGGHILDAGGASIDMTHWYDLEDAIPEKYFRGPEFMYLTSRGIELAWKEYLTDRQTSLGDQYVVTSAEGRVLGRPLFTSPLLPSNVEMIAGAGNEGMYKEGDNSFIFLLQPKNMIMGVWRKLLVETDKDIERQIYKVVLSMRIGLTMEEPDAIAVLTNIRRRPTRP